MRVVIKLPEAWFDIVCMNVNVMFGEGDSEVPQMGEEVCHGSAEGVIEIFGGSHEVNGNGIYGGAFCRIENELVFPSFLDMFVVWSEEDVWREPGNPSQDEDIKIVMHLFVDGVHDCIKFLGIDGSMLCSQ